MNARWLLWNLALCLCTVLAACDAPAGDGARRDGARAHDDEPRLLLAVSKTSESGGAGTVTGGGLINCGTACLATFPAGSAVTLTATAAPSSAFQGWGGACVGTATTCVVTMTQDQSVTATFRVVYTPTYGLLVTNVAQGGGVGLVTGSTTPGNLQISCPTGCFNRFTEGTAVTLTAAAASSSTAFLGWGGACAGTAPTCVVTMTEDRGVTATFAAAGPTYPITVTRAGTGAGTVRSRPAGIDCGAVCSDTWARDTVVTLFPTASVDSVFTGWSGACSGTSLCTIPLTEAAAVTATFAGGPDLSLLVTLAGDGDGRVSSDTFTCPDFACAAYVPAGTPVTLNAWPAFTSAFAGWGGACSGTDPTCTVIAGPGVQVSASFTRSPPMYRLTVTTAGTGAGYVTSQPAGLACGASCSSLFLGDGVVTLTAAPVAGAGSVFAGWAGACTGTASTCTVSMSQARSVTATFDATSLRYPLTVSRSGTGEGHVFADSDALYCGTRCSQGFVEGAVATLTAIAASESRFAGWSGACTGTSLTCVVTMGAGGQAVRATFDTTLQTYALRVATSGAGDAGVVATPSGEIQCGSTCGASFVAGRVVTLTASTGTGALFTGWGGACTGTAPTCAVMMSRDREVTAAFQPLPPPAYCKVVYGLNAEWPGGFGASLSIQNTGTATWSGWTVRWTYPDPGQKITQTWNALASQRGQEVTLTNQRYNGVVPPGAAVPGVGFNGTWKVADPPPAKFSVNGVACTN